MKLIANFFKKLKYVFFPTVIGNFYYSKSYLIRLFKLDEFDVTHLPVEIYYKEFKEMMKIARIKKIGYTLTEYRDIIRHLNDFYYDDLN